MNNEQKVQECDARDDAMKNRSWVHSKKFIILNSIFLTFIFLHQYPIYKTADKQTNKPGIMIQIGNPFRKNIR